MTTPPPKVRAVVFIDGSNFYHSARRIRVNIKHLDIHALFQNLVDERQSVLYGVRYYAGQVQNNPAQKSAYDKQQKFFGTLKKHGVVIRRGRITENYVVDYTSRLLQTWLRDNLAGAALPAAAHSELSVMCAQPHLERKEKGVDMMCGMDMVTMAVDDGYDVAYLVSGDTDFAPVVKMLQEQLKKTVFVCSLNSIPRVLRKTANECIEISPDKLQEFGGKESGENNYAAEYQARLI